MDDDRLESGELCVNCGRREEKRGEERSIKR